MGAGWARPAGSTEPACASGACAEGSDRGSECAAAETGRADSAAEESGAGSESADSGSDVAGDARTGCACFAGKCAEPLSEHICAKSASIRG